MKPRKNNHFYRYIFIAILCLSGKSWFVFSEKPVLPKENQVIISTEDKTWEIEEEDTHRAINAILDFLINPEKHKNAYAGHKNNIKNILNNFQKYKVQFWPEIKSGSRIIYCNFFYSSHNAPNWKTVPVIVEDGGSHFWQIEYNLDTDECSNISVNGEA